MLYHSVQLATAVLSMTCASIVTTSVASRVSGVWDTSRKNGGLYAPPGFGPSMWGLSLGVVCQSASASSVSSPKAFLQMEILGSAKTALARLCEFLHEVTKQPDAA